MTTRGIAAGGNAADSIFLPPGTGAVSRSVASKLGDLAVSVFDFMTAAQIADVKARTLSLDVAAACQAAITYVEANALGGVVYFPKGSYSLVASGLSNSRLANSALGRVSLVGEDENGTRLVYTGAGSTCISIANNHTLSGEEFASYQTISDMTIIGPSLRASSFGIVMNVGSFPKFERLNIQSFDFAMYLQDVDHAYFEKVNNRFNLRGLFATKNASPGTASTQPNNFTFVSCSLSNNTNYGAHILGGSDINFYGGDVEYNGSVGAGGFGLQFEDCGYEGGRGANIDGVYFEGNNGIADVILKQATDASVDLAVVHRIASDFKRLSNSVKTTNLILCAFGADSTVGHAQLVLDGCVFKDYAGYTPDAATRYIAYSVTAANVNNFFDYGSYYSSTTELPAWIYSNANVTAVGNVGSGTDNLITYSMPASSLIRAKQGVRIIAWGTSANNANAKTLTLNFGSATILTHSLTASIAGVWRIVAEVFSTGTDAQTYISQLVTTGTAGAAVNDVEQGTCTEDDGATITIKCTGAATDNDDIIQKGFFIEYLNG